MNGLVFCFNELSCHDSIEMIIQDTKLLSSILCLHRSSLVFQMNILCWTCMWVYFSCRVACDCAYFSIRKELSQFWFWLQHRSTHRYSPSSLVKYLTSDMVTTTNVIHIVTGINRSTTCLAPYISSSSSVLSTALVVPTSSTTAAAASLQYMWAAGLIISQRI